MPNENGPKVAVEGHGLLAVTTRRALGPMLHGRSETADLVWFCEDTPVDENDVGNINWIFGLITSLACKVPSQIPIMISSTSICRASEAVFASQYLIMAPKSMM